MQQPRGGHRDTPGPGAAADQQARLAAFDLQQLALGRLGEDRLDHMLALGERRHLGQVGIGRLPGEILLEVVRRHRGVHVAVLDLHRDIVLVVHDQRVEHPLAFAHVQCQGALGAGDLLAEGDHLATMAMPAGRDLVGDIVHLEQCRLALGLGDEGTDPCMRTSRPSLVSSRRARLMVMRLKPSWLTSSLSEGTRWCGGQAPDWIWLTIICLTRA